MFCCSSLHYITEPESLSEVWVIGHIPQFFFNKGAVPQCLTHWGKFQGVYSTTHFQPQQSVDRGLSPSSTQSCLRNPHTGYLETCQQRVTQSITV